MMYFLQDTAFVVFYAGMKEIMDRFPSSAGKKGSFLREYKSSGEKCFPGPKKYIVCSGVGNGGLISPLGDDH